MHTQINSEVFETTSAPAPVLAKRGPGRPKSTGPTVASLRAEIKSLDAWRRPRAIIREAWPGAFALLVVFVPYYATTLHVLGDRYEFAASISWMCPGGARPVCTESTSTTPSAVW